MQEQLIQDLDAIYLGNLHTVEADIELPSQGKNGSKFFWTSNQEHLISNDGEVFRPENGKGNRRVILRLRAELDGLVEERDYQATVLEMPMDFFTLEPVEAVFKIYVEEDVETINFTKLTIPQFGICRNRNGGIQVQKVRWKYSTIEKVEEDLYRVSGIPAQGKGLSILDRNADMHFTAQIKILRTKEKLAQEADLQNVPLDKITLLEGRLRKNYQSMLKHLLEVDIDQLLYSFRKASGIDTLDSIPMTGWDAMESKLRGHTTGHYLSSFSLAAASNVGDEGDIYYQKASALVDGLAEVQEAFYRNAIADYGFVSAYTEEQFDLLEEYVRYPEIWAPYYTLHKIVAGLLDAYELLDMEKALEVLDKLFTWLKNRLFRLDKKTLQNMWGMYIAGEFGGMNEVIARYAKIAKDKDLEFLLDSFENEKLYFPLEQDIDALSNMHANQHIPQILGAIESYRLTGEKRYWDLASRFWDFVHQSHLYVIGGVGEGEMFHDPNCQGHFISDKTAESCASYNMLKLSKELYNLSKDVKYLSYIENTLFNHIAPSFQCDNADGGTTYFMPVSPGASYDFDTDGNSCCHGTGLESHFLSAKYFYSLEKTNKKKRLHVHLFAANELLWPEEEICLRQVRNFKTDEKAEYEFLADADLSLIFRKVDWASKMLFEKNGETITPDMEGDTFVLRGPFHKGDRITISFAFAWQKQSIAGDDSLHAVKYGPYVMFASSNKTDYLPLPSLEDLNKAKKERKDESFYFTVNDLVFRPQEDNKGDSYHLYFKD